MSDQHIPHEPGRMSRSDLNGHRLPEWFIAEQDRIHWEAFEERERERARRGEPTSREQIARLLAEEQR